MENTDSVLYTERRFKDHLHIRGEYGKAASTKAILAGSPPHTWRILGHANIKMTLDRITSTYVENTDSQIERLKNK